jgi:hypothetical protein
MAWSERVENATNSFKYQVAIRVFVLTTFLVRIFRNGRISFFTPRRIVKFAFVRFCVFTACDSFEDSASWFHKQSTDENPRRGDSHLFDLGQSNCHVVTWYKLLWLWFSLGLVWIYSLFMVLG